jgi:hypothetical protein
MANIFPKYQSQKRWRKGLVEWLKGWNTCLVSMRPCIQTPVPLKKKKRKTKELYTGGD